MRWAIERFELHGTQDMQWGRTTRAMLRIMFELEKTDKYKEVFVKESSYRFHPIKNWS